MKHIFIIRAALCLAALCLIAGCAKKKDTTPGTIKVGISKIVAHEALDAAEQGVIDRLTASGRAFTFDRQNASGDMSAAAQIAAQFKNEKVDFAVGIATPAAAALVNQIKDIPVIYSAVTNPVTAKLVDTLDRGAGNVTGVSDAIDVPTHLRMFQEITGLKTLGYLFTSSEDNSASSRADVQKAVRNLDITLVEQAITNSSELKQTAEMIIGRVDGIYITNDNTIYSALPALIEVCNKAKKPLFSADVTSCKSGGAFIAYGFDYYKIGIATGDIILQILDGKKPADIPAKFLTEASDVDFLLDLDQAKACGITIPEKFLNAANYIFENGTLTQK